jgi:hypothetical protein
LTVIHAANETVDAKVSDFTSGVWRFVDVIIVLRQELSAEFSQSHVYSMNERDGEIGSSRPI